MIIQKKKNKRSYFPIFPYKIRCFGIVMRFPDLITSQEIITQLNSSYMQNLMILAS